MPLATTTIGAYPKPGWLPITDWFKREAGQTVEGGEVTRRMTRALRAPDQETEAAAVKATHQAVKDQAEAGIDIPTDGEQRRENYIHYHCRHLEGFDFENLTRRALRGGAYEADLPTIRARINPRGNHFLDRDFKIAQGAVNRPVKITIPGPLTIMDTTANLHYADEGALARDLADALNYEIRALADAGCRYIQVDEPVFARQSERALKFGVECLERCFHGVPEGVTRVMHMCCGYPAKLDDEDYKKADPQSYFTLATALDQSAINQISIEDAHRHNDLSLFELFKRSTLILGSVAIAQSRVEPVDEISSRLSAVLDHIDGHRLIAAPDCGLGYLSRELAIAKLSNLCTAARKV